MDEHRTGRSPRADMGDEAHTRRSLLVPLAVVAAFALSCVATYSGLLSLVATSESEAGDALEASRALSALYRLNSLESTAEAGEAVSGEDLDRAITDLALPVGQAVEHLGEIEAAAALAEVGDYAAAVRTTVERYTAFRAGGGTEDEREAAEDFDLEVTDPVYRRLEARLAAMSETSQAISTEASHDARTGIVALLAASTVTFLLFGWWLVRANRRAASRRSARTASARFRSLVEASSDQIYLIGPAGEVVYSSPGAERAWDGQVPANFAAMAATLDPDARDRLSAAVQDGTASLQVTATARRQWGEVVHLAITCRDLRADPHVGGVVITARDVTEQQELHDRLRHQAQEDELTGLPNRRMLNTALAAAVARSRRHGRRAALLLVDLDGFKGVNDTLGHPVGDELLRQVATRMRTATRGGEIVGRLGGDEFAVVLEEIGDEEDALLAGARFLDVLRQPYDVQGNLLAINASLGLAMLADGSDAREPDVDDLFRHADIALYEAKQGGRNRLVAFRPDMEHLVLAAARLQRELVSALERGELSLVYQPLCELDTGVPVSFEALMRWYSPTLGEVSPMTFIPVAERSGLILDLGRWALETACRQLADWKLLLPDRPLGMSVNVSVLQVAEHGFLDDVRRVLAETGIAPGDLQLEVTESALANDLDRLSVNLSEIRDLGVRIALDDFGTGYSSMGQLQQLPVDCIKIDRSFVSALRDGGERARSFVDALVDLGAALGLSIVAEGIEEPAQLDAFRRDDCGLAQGYLLARPMPPAAALAFVRQHTPAEPASAQR